MRWNEMILIPMYHHIFVFNHHDSETHLAYCGDPGRVGHQLLANKFTNWLGIPTKQWLTFII